MNWSDISRYKIIIFVKCFLRGLGIIEWISLCKSLQSLSMSDTCVNTKYHWLIIWICYRMANNKVYILTRRIEKQVYKYVKSTGKMGFKKQVPSK